MFFRKNVNKELENIIKDLINIRKLFEEGLKLRVSSESSVFARFRREFRRKHISRKLPYLDVDEIEVHAVKTLNKLRNISKRLTKLFNAVKAKTRSYRLVFLLKESLSTLNDIIDNITSGALVREGEIVKMLDDVIAKLNEAKTIIRLEEIK